MLVTTTEQLRSVVAEFMQFDEFVFDLETVYTPTEEEAAEHTRVRALTAKQRTIDEQKWLEVFELKATDPLVNEVIWIGMAGPGGVTVAIPCGHPKGRQLRAARKEKKPASEVYAIDDPRRWTKGGKESTRLVMVSSPAIFEPPPPQLSVGDVFEGLKPLFFAGKRLIGHNVKFDIKTVVKYFGDFPTAPYMDTIIAQHVLDEKLLDYGLDALTKRHFMTSYDKLGSKGVQNFSYGQATRYVMRDCRYTWLLWQKFKRRLQRNETLWRFLTEYEAATYEAVVRMEYEGVPVDRSAVGVERKLKEREIRATLDRIIVDFKAPPTFNPNAAADKIELLRKHKAKFTRRTKKTNAISVDAEALEGIKERGGPAGEVASLFLDYADQSKTLGTYLVGLPHRLDANDRVHADYLLHGTETSRFSCREPNIQNIPHESTMRSMFVAPPGHVFVIGDYDQIELRFIGVLSQDPAMMELFISGQDIHRGTAALVVNKPFDAVTPDERQNFGKMPNFLLGYGGGAPNLAEKTGITIDRAEWVLAQYYRRFARINPWKDSVIRQAKARAKFSTVNGERRMTVPPYVETMLGRRRRLPALLWNENKLRMQAERQAVNTIVQGSASETAKLAMCAITDYYKETGFPMKLVINVHDELVCTVPERHADEAQELLAELMSGVRIPHTGERPLGDRVPLAVKTAVADRWLK